MYSGDPPTHTAPWPFPQPSSTAAFISPVVEVDEDEPPPFASAAHDSEQALSAGLLLSQDSRTRILQPTNSAPTRLGAPVGSASPAAAFLSFFRSPSPAPAPDAEANVVAGYTLGPIIGYGSTSIIRRATSASGTTAAVKIVRRADLVKAGNAPHARRRLQHEAAIWATLTHEHVLPLFSTVHDPYADYFFTVYCPAGSLFDILKRDGRPALPQDDAGMMFRQVVRGLRYLHEDAGYVHRDMKLENVLVDETGLCKIGDFGMSRRIGAPDDESGDDEVPPPPPEGATSFPLAASGVLHRAVSLAAPARRQPKVNYEVNLQRHNSARHRNSTSTAEPAHSFQPGSLPYAAPEILLPQTSDASHPHPSQDIWALGVMLYALLTGRLPFADSFEPRLQMKILNGSYQTPADIGRGAERILQGCLERAPAERWTITMVDDVAWGVGWGAEGDDAHAAHAEDDGDTTPAPCAPRAASRPRPAELELIVPPATDWPPDAADHPHPSADAAARRSSSRAQRSRSRAPVPTSTSSSARSRPPLSARTSRASASSSASSTFRDAYALDTDASPTEAEWAAAPRSAADSRSRSRSPSIAPRTPPDGARVAFADALMPPDELLLDGGGGGRGRPAVRAEMRKVVAGGRARSDSPMSEEEDEADERAPCAHVMRVVAGVARMDVDCAADGDDAGRRTRPTSSPPIAPRTPLACSAPDGSVPGPEAFLRAGAATVAVAANMIARSRSAGAAQ